MLVRIPSVLSHEALTQAHKIIGTEKFVDGKLSAGHAARRVKNNEEIDVQSNGLAQLNNIVMSGLVQHPLYRAAVLPFKVAAPYYARYQAGMSYGDHIDDPIMQADTPYRSDVSITIFLSDPADYDGGELVVRTSFGEEEVKLPAGDAVAYPSSSIHHVNEVIKGTRLVAVTWIQSMVRDPRKREILYDLYQARESMLANLPDDDITKKVDHSYVNLVRMWSDL